MPAEKSSHVATEAFRILRTLYQLSTDFFSSENRDDLHFRILNSTISLFPYHRAVLWSFDGRRPRLIGVSGQEGIGQRTPMADIWRDIVQTLTDHKQPVILKGDSSHNAEQWQALAQKVDGISVLWVPVMENGELRAGLWLERWGGDAWDASECEIMKSLAQNIGQAWSHYHPLRQWRKKERRRRLRFPAAMAAGVLLMILLLAKVPLRVVAPCEIVPKNPTLIAAPLEGVIKEVRVQPGWHVEKDDLLFLYEDRIVLHELKVAQKQVDLIQSKYDRAMMRNPKDAETYAEIQSLKYQLAQETIRLALARENAGRLKVRAPVSGTCMLKDPEQWSGKPVEIGERVMIIFQPANSKVKIFLPENDNIQFDVKKPVNVILHANPAASYKSKLVYIAPRATENPVGGAAFVAEAEFNDANTGIRVGSKGTAIVYGEAVHAWYWLLRKPMAGIRQLLGL